MDRVKLDAADRRILGIALVLAVLFVILCVVVGGGIGAGVMMYRLVSGG